jgi:hypothetical protein
MEKEVPFPKCSFMYLSKSPAKEHPLQVLLSDSHRERDTPFPEPSFTCLSKSPAKKPLLQVPVGSLWREMLVTRAFFYISFRVPSKGDPTPGSLSQPA